MSEQKMKCPECGNHPNNHQTYCGEYNRALTPALTQAAPGDYAELVNELQIGHDADCELHGDPEDHASCCTCTWVERKKAADRITTLLAANDALAERVRELNRHGYVIAMRLMQSEVRLDDAEQAGLDAFITKANIRTAIGANHDRAR